ncbi:MAG TPA: hypothetical protein VGF11_09800 [Acidimicrobiales bacterium]|jgi:hypothetical protein
MAENLRQTGNHLTPLQLDSKLLRLGAVLAGVGGAVWLAGITVGGLALGSAARQWVQQLDHPPRELARIKLRQAMAAGAAGADAWSKGPPD